MHRRLASMAAAALGWWTITTTCPVSATAKPSEAPMADQELGARVGLRMAGRTTPGGLVIDGVYLYRLTGNLWSDSEAGFSFGGDGAGCFRDRANKRICDHAMLEGVAGFAHTGVRWVRPAQGGLVPYARAQIGLELIRYPDDDVGGVSVPIIVGGGVRSRVTEEVSIGAGADLLLGVADINSGVGTEPQAALIVHVGVSFTL